MSSGMLVDNITHTVSEHNGQSIVTNTYMYLYIFFTLALPPFEDSFTRPHLAL